MAIVNQQKKPRFFSEFLGDNNIKQQFISGPSGREIQQRASQIGINPVNLQPIQLLPEGGQLPQLSQPRQPELVAPTAPAPITPTPQQTQRQQLQRQVLTGFQATEAEQGLQQQIGKIISGRELGLAQLPGQGRGIVSGLVRGQQERLEAQSAARLVPLQRQLAIEQARRQAASDVASKELEFQRAEEKPIQVGERLVQRTPEGGFRTVFEPPAEEAEPQIFKSGDDLVRVSADGTEVEVIHEAPPEDKNLDIEFFTDPATRIVTKVVTDPATGEEIKRENLGAIGAGFKPREISESEIAAALERTEKNEEARATQASTIGLISSILQDPNLARVSGSRIGRLGAGFTGTAGVRGQLNQLEALTSLEGRSKLKGSGTISDFEAKMLGDSANALNFAIQDDGQVAMSDDDVVRNLRNIRGSLLLKAGQSVPAIVTNPEDGETIQTQLTSQEAQDLFLDGNLINFQ